MARFRRKKTSRRSFFKRRGRSRSSGMGSVMTTVLAAGVYGAAREPIARAISPVTDSPMLKNVLGNASDEVVLLGGALLGRKFIGKMPLGKELTNAVIIVEAARIGEMLRTGTLMTSSGSGSGSSVIIG